VELAGRGRGSLSVRRREGHDRWGKAVGEEDESVRAQRRRGEDEGFAFLEPSKPRADCRETGERNQRPVLSRAPPRDSWKQRQS
jgi:hypothetical protein